MSYNGPDHKEDGDSYNHERHLANQLSDNEIKELRKIIESEKRMRWLWSSLRSFAIGVISVVTMLTVGYTMIVDVIKGIASK